MDERRYYGLDALRGVMMLLGVVIHGAMFYTAMLSEVIPLRDPRTSPVLDVIVLLIHSFRMPLFFLLSGFFGALLVEKYGVKGAFWNRVQRVLAPFLVALIAVMPLTGWMALSFGVSADLGTRVLWTTADPAHLAWADRFARKLFPERNRLPGPGHLWFLYYLMMFYLLTPLLAAVRRWLEGRGRSVLVRRVAASPWLPLALAVWTALTLWPFPGGLVWGFQYFRPHPPSVLYYGTFFALGYLLHGFRDFLTTSRRYLPAYAAGSVPLFLASLPLTAIDHRQAGADPTLHVATVSVHALLTWLLGYTAIGLFQRRFDRDSPWVAYVSQSSYWVYLVHVAAVSFAAWGLVTVDVPAIVKFAVVVSFTTITVFVSYHYLVRRTWISVLLNGRRFSMDWPWREPGGRAYSVPMGRASSTD